MPTTRRFVALAVLDDAVAALKQKDGADLHVIGSTKLVQTLATAWLLFLAELIVMLSVVPGRPRLGKPASEYDLVSAPT